MATAPGFNIGSKLNFRESDASREYNTVSDLLNNILPNVYIAAGLVIFFMILFGGFMVISNAGNPDKTKEGSKIITSAIIGLLVLFASYWIIQLIQIVTGISILNSKI